MSERLSRSRGVELRETVATIQPEQYQQIAGQPAQVMFIQGVAGSGKSIVGLHRIAYLLSPFNELSARITSASRVVFFGPTRTFLTYVANLLPSLNVRHVPQRTVRDWLQSTLSAKVIIGHGEPLLEKLLRHSDRQWDALHKAAKLKGSLQMARTLERHVRAQAKRSKDAATPLAVRLDSPTLIILERTVVRRIARSLPSDPLNTQRERLIENLIDAVWNDPASASVVERTEKKALRDRIHQQVEQQVNAFWPHLDFRREYRRLLSDSQALEAASIKRINEHDRALLTASLPRGHYVFQVEDLGALAYLDHLLTERPNSSFEHVVLDEAQEVSPIEFMVIQRHSQRRGFTILGDLTQSLSPQGIDQWRELLQLFPGATVSRYVARTSFRATREITRYANRVLKRASPRSVTAEPFPREGRPPSFIRSNTFKEMVEAIAIDIRRFDVQGVKTIGVLSKSAIDAKRLHQALRAAGLQHAWLMAGEDTRPGGNVVVAPIYLARGLEFDSVILAGASKDSYPDTPLHGKLLYLAVSRAAHHLNIHWVGQPAHQLCIPRPTRPKKNRGRRRAAGHAQSPAKPGASQQASMPSPGVLGPGAVTDSSSNVQTVVTVAANPVTLIAEPVP
ncbi:MAG: ATP-binding domain-containing protein [Verrucomicrobia bacterium]|nr:ATP-binding domain-containing protein [Verrucomicrobiota bacterium]